MKNEKTEEIENISVEDMIKKLHFERDKILDNFAKAYLAESELMPSDVELVTRQMPTVDGIIENIYFFRRKA